MQVSRYTNWNASINVLRGFKHRHPLLVLLARAAITIVLYVLLAGLIDGAEFARHLVDVRWAWLLLGVAIPVIGIGISVYRWKLILELLGFQRSYGDLLQRYWSGSFYNTVLPGSVGGDVVRIGGLVQSGVPMASSTLSVIADRALGLGAAMVLGLFASLWPSDLPLRSLGAMFALLVGSGVVIVLGASSSNRFLPQRFAHLGVQLRSLRPHTNWGLMVAVVGFQITVILHLYVIAQALGNPLSFLACALYMPAVVLATLLPVSLNGIGVREASLTVLLAGIGVAPETAVAIGLLLACTSIMSSLPGGVLSFWSPR